MRTNIPMNTYTTHIITANHANMSMNMTHTITANHANMSMSMNMVTLTMATATMKKRQQVIWLLFLMSRQARWILM